MADELIVRKDYGDDAPFIPENLNQWMDWAKQDNPKPVESPFLTTYSTREEAEAFLKAWFENQPNRTYGLAQQKRWFPVAPLPARERSIHPTKLSPVTQAVRVLCG